MSNIFPPNATPPNGLDGLSLTSVHFFVGYRQVPAHTGPRKEKTMDIGSVLVVALIVLLWIAAAAAGNDSRDGRDSTRPRGGDERRHRIGS
jgi:hypothetical protein